MGNVGLEVLSDIGKMYVSNTQGVVASRFGAGILSERNVGYGDEVHLRDTDIGTT